jgi:hypothetical protein
MNMSHSTHLLVPGSCSLIGSEVSLFFADQGFRVTGIDGNQRAVFFGSESDTRRVWGRVQREIPRYPQHKLQVHLLVSTFLREMYRATVNNLANVFKAYRRTALNGCGQFFSPHFNLAVELPMKINVRGYTWTWMPIAWRKRAIE